MRRQGEADADPATRLNSHSRFAIRGSPFAVGRVFPKTRVRRAPRYTDAPGRRPGDSSRSLSTETQDNRPREWVRVVLARVDTRPSSADRASRRCPARRRSPARRADRGRASRPRTPVATPSACSRARSSSPCRRARSAPTRPASTRTGASAASQRLASAGESLHVRIGKDHDRKLEAFGLVDRHQPHAVASLFENRRLGRLRGLGGARSSRRIRGTKCRPPLRIAAPARRRAARWRAPVRLPAEGRTRRARASRSAAPDRSATGRCCAADAAAASSWRAPPIGARCAWNRWRQAETDGRCQSHPRGVAEASLEQLLVADREQRPASVANTDISSSGHSIAASAARIVSISSRLWNVLPPTSRCGCRALRAPRRTRA